MDWIAIRTQANALFEQLHEIHVQFYHLWASNVFLSWRWWVAVSLIIVPWGFWLIVKKKRSTDRLLYAGLVVMVVSSSMDTLGIAFGLWSYPANAFPLMPEFIPFDISALPVATMLFIQFFPKVKPVYKALIYAAAGSFLFQPLMNALCLYDKMSWQNWYSFPILFLIYLLANYMAGRRNFDPVDK